MFLMMTIIMMHVRLIYECFPRSDEFEGQGQRSKVKVTRDKDGILRPFRRPACDLYLIKLQPLLFALNLICVRACYDYFFIFRCFVLRAVVTVFLLYDCVNIYTGHNKILLT